MMIINVRVEKERNVNNRSICTLGMSKKKALQEIEPP